MCITKSAHVYEGMVHISFSLTNFEPIKPSDLCLMAEVANYTHLGTVTANQNLGIKVRIIVPFSRMRYLFLDVFNTVRHVWRVQHAATCLTRSTRQDVFYAFNTPGRVWRVQHARTCLTRSTHQDVFDAFNTPRRVWRVQHAAPCLTRSTCRAVFDAFNTPRRVWRVQHAATCFDAFNAPQRVCSVKKVSTDLKTLLVYFFNGMCKIAII